jgi:hypothetical protein
VMSLFFYCISDFVARVALPSPLLHRAVHKKRADSCKNLPFFLCILLFLSGILPMHRRYTTKAVAQFIF